MSQIPPTPPGPPGPPGPPPPNVPPAQSWTPPGTPPPGGSKTGLFVVLGLLVLAAVGGGLYLLTSNSDGSGGGGSPEAAVRSFYQAAKDADCEALVDSMTSDSWSFVMSDFDATSESAGEVSRDAAVADCKEQASSDENFAATGTVTATEVASESGDTAVVSVTTEDGGEETTEEIPVAKEGGKWKLDFAQLFADSGIGDLSEEELDIPEEDLDQQIEDLEEELETGLTIPEP